MIPTIQHIPVGSPKTVFLPQPACKPGIDPGSRIHVGNKSPFQHVLMIDNFDSFTYNLVHCFRAAGMHCTVLRNDDPSIASPDVLSGCDLAVISPGPATPSDAGLLMQFCRNLPPGMPVLGICLGMQALGMADGAKLCRAPVPVHGKVSMLQCIQHQVFKGLPEKIAAMRYHSLMLNFENASNWDIIALANDDVPMMCEHRLRPWLGMQFHPESVLTRYGPALLHNSLEYLAWRTVDK